MDTPEGAEPGAAPERGLPRRRSRYVERGDYPGVAAREQLNELLRVHDGLKGAETFDRVTAEQLVLLRLIATAPASAEDDPRIRHRAILALGRVGGPQEQNTLLELARTDPDPATRGSALLSLAETGQLLASTVLRDAVGARDPIERTAAVKAVQRLTELAGSDAVIEAAHTGSRSARRAAEFADLVKSSESTRAQARRHKPARTRSDPESGR